VTTLVDTSVWIEFLRGTPTPATAYLRRDLGTDTCTTEPIMMELLAGTRPGAQMNNVERLLLSQAWLRIEPAIKVDPHTSDRSRVFTMEAGMRGVSDEHEQRARDGRVRGVRRRR